MTSGQWTMGANAKVRVCLPRDRVPKFSTDRVLCKVRSDDESVATVKDGIVTAVGAGKTEIHAIWGDIDLVCVVRCNFITTPTGIPGSDAVGEG